MNEQDNGQVRAPAQSQDGSAQPGAAGFGAAPRFTVDKKSAKKHEAVLGPFTIRDLTVFGSTLLLFIASLIPMFALAYNLWNLGSLFFLGLGIVLPLIVTALFVARRLSPATRIRIGSLSIDQFASVVASFTLAFFFLAAAEAFVPSMLIALLGAAGLFAATVLGRWIPFFASDFAGREETPAHVVAREAVAPVQKPRAPKKPKQPKPVKDSAAASGASAGWANRPGTGTQTAAAPAAVSPVVPPAEATTGAGTPAAAPGAAATGAPATQISGVVPTAGTAGPAPFASPAAASSAAGSTAPSTAQSAEPAQSAGAPAPVADQKPATGVAAASPATGAAAAAAAAAAGPAASSDAEQTRAADIPAPAGGSAPTTVNPQVRPQEPIGATVDPASRPSEDEVHPAQEAFWFAVAQPRTAVDERTGAPAFVIEPGGWVLALEDRGTSFLVQHTDGRLGVLRDLSNIERG
ncbi:hypothetical protein [Arthrobacter oryzae]|uniref:Uncharacterized protein n=1 Tax=Arthrobacter oryzae TaxID=409290 RepID=A0A495EV83_9MICC|nr:hypothetical protein [Arthrobacter oryzae]RKR20870.1 hypothetical protein C8D78_1512 [Arthrobacter oryzae]